MLVTKCSALASRPPTIPGTYFRARNDVQLTSSLLLSKVPLILFGQRRHELLGHLKRSWNDAAGSGFRVPDIRTICNAAAAIWVAREVFWILGTQRWIIASPVVGGVLFRARAPLNFRIGNRHGISVPPEPMASGESRAKKGTCRRGGTM